MKLNPIKNHILATAGVASVAMLSSCANAQQPQPGAMGAAAQNAKPNVVFILADDLGWMDTAVYGSKFYDTPNIDALRARGMMFTRAYTANPLCSPTRASILTGQYPGRMHLTAPQGNLEVERTEVEMPKNAGPGVKVITAPSVTRLPLKYGTMGDAFKAAGYTTAFMGKWHLGRGKFMPQSFGFDKVVGAGPFPGPPSFFSPYKMGPYLSDGPVGEHIDDRMAREANGFIEANKNKPFLLNVWTWDVHAPFQAKPEYIKEYRAKVDPKNPQRSPIYAGMVKSTDDLVGSITKKLDDLKLTNKTMIVFYSDNGGNTYDRVEGIPPTSNAPLRNGKGSIWDGGTRVPMLVSWPGHIKPGSTSDALVSSIDFYPTLLDIAGAKGKAGQVVDGVDIRPVLEGTGTLKRDTIFCHFPHNIPATDTPASVYVIQDYWKLIRIFAGNDDQSDKFELYDLSKDIGETDNLALKMQVKVQQMNALITQHLKETDALVPFANPNYKGPGETIGGWEAGGTAMVKQFGDAIQIVSSGGDPFFFTGEVPKASGPYTIKFRMNTRIGGDGTVFWAPNKKGFAATKSVDFTINRDGQFHDYSVSLPENKEIGKLRIDTGKATGDATIDWIRLFDGNNKLVKAWEFDAKK